MSTLNPLFSAEDERFRLQVREWLEASKPRTPRPGDAQGQRDYDLGWQRTQYVGGWAGIAWPKEYGGLGLPLIRQLIWYEEYARAEAPHVGASMVGLNHGGPTLIVRASEEQKAFHLPKILKGEVVWSQGFSEPGSGSDLASLRTRGRVEDGHLVVNGQKIWTSYAHISDYQELLVRTDPDSSRHRGLTWIICDMQLPGITIRPIRNMVGDHHFNEVFYDNVRIPLGNVVGRIGEGWSVAMSTLGFERGTAHARDQIELSLELEKLIAYARVHPGPDGVRPAIQDDEFAGRLAMLRAEMSALRSLVYTMVSRIEKTGSPGPEGSIVRLYFAETKQRMTRLAADLLGVAAIERRRVEGLSSLDYLNSLRFTISAGTAEIQRNIIGERILGLPRGK